MSKNNKTRVKKNIVHIKGGRGGGWGFEVSWT